MQKLGKQRQIKLPNIIKSKYGTMDYMDLKSIFISMQCWIKPKNNNYNSIITKLRRDISNTVKNNIDKSIFHDTLILDIDVRESGFDINKRSFISIDVNLYVKNSNMKFNDKQVYNNVSIITEMVNETLYKNEISIYKTKK
jgi:hypothetical protein